MLVITDNTTRYLEVFPLKTVKARTVGISVLQTDVLMKSLNQTLKQMLQKLVNLDLTVISEFPIYCLLTGRSLSILLASHLLSCYMAREEQSPLSLSKQSWMGGREAPDSQHVLSYVL